MRWHHLQAKATHNSYRPGPTAAGERIAAWRYRHRPLPEQLQVQGVRALELDLHWIEDADDFPVYHERGLGVLRDDRTSCHSLERCLRQIRGWSAAHPAHHVLFVFIQTKSMPTAPTLRRHMYARLDRIANQALGRHLIQPAQVLAGYPHAGAVASAAAWPTLDATRGRVALVLLPHADDNKDYLRCTHSGRRMFLAAKGDQWLQRRGHIPTEAGFVSFEDPLRYRRQVRALVRAGRLVRAHVDYFVHERVTGDFDKLRHAQSAGVHFLTTDFPWPTSYPVPESAQSVLRRSRVAEALCQWFWVDVPGGNPSRCNPVTTGWPGCDGRRLEALGRGATLHPCATRVR